MGAAQMTRKEIQAHVQIDAWAQQSVTAHRRECEEKICGGKQKIWWIVRHPNCHPQISNPAAREYVINRLHVCAPLLVRLAEPAGTGQDQDKIPWLPGEFNVYVNRTDQEVAELIGREEKSAPTEELPSKEELQNPFPEVQKSFPKTRSQTNREAYLAGKAEQQQRRTRRTQPATGLGSVLDALNNPRNGR
jgi:hypothetical protein